MREPISYLDKVKKIQAFSKDNAEIEDDSKTSVIINSKEEQSVYIHSDAEVSPLARIGDNSRIFELVQILERTSIGKQCVLYRGVFIDRDVSIGNMVVIQRGSIITRGAMIDSGVFIGPYVCFTNNPHPRAVTPQGGVFIEDEDSIECVHIRYGATIGAGSIISPGIRIGSHALITPGSVVTTDVPAQALFSGNPAVQTGYVCRCGRKLVQLDDSNGWHCTACNEIYNFS